MSDSEQFNAECLPVKELEKHSTPCITLSKFLFNKSEIIVKNIVALNFRYKCFKKKFSLKFNYTTKMS